MFARYILYNPIMIDAVNAVLPPQSIGKASLEAMSIGQMHLFLFNSVLPSIEKHGFPEDL